MDLKNVNLKSISVKLQRLLMIMAAIMMALVTFTACDENESDADENGNGGGVAGKRLKSYIVSSPENVVRSEYSYNDDGTLKRIDNYDHVSSKLFQYVIITSFDDGTMAKQEQYLTDFSFVTVWNFSNDANKKPLKREGTTSMDGIIIGTSTADYTFQNGRKIREVVKDYSGAVQQETLYEFSYGSNGRRTTTLQTIYGQSSSQYTRTYNSDGTLQQVTSPSTTITFTWENGKTTVDFDDHAQF
jgi:hypothetical protein